MNNEILNVILTDALWVLVIGGWILLIATGLERDKPLSGGIPGILDSAIEEKDGYLWGAGDKLGELGSWVVFGIGAATLPLLLYWIFAVHPR